MNTTENATKAMQTAGLLIADLQELNKDDPLISLIVLPEIAKAVEIRNTAAAILSAMKERNARATTQSTKCRQTACRYCGLDIENFSPYRRGEWRDRGSNMTCPHGDNAGKVHEPVRP